MLYEKHFDNLFWDFQLESLWCSMEIATLKKVFYVKNNSVLPKLVVHYLEKEVQGKPVGDKDADLVDKDSTLYSIDSSSVKWKP